MARTTTEVKAMLEYANEMLSNTEFQIFEPGHYGDQERTLDPKAVRMGVAIMIEKVLHNSGNYAGFGYNAIKLDDNGKPMKTDKGYLIYDAKENKQVVRTYFKTTAVAIAKNLAQGKDITEQAMEFDDTMLKHYNDAIFYKHAIRNTTDETKKEIRETRLDVAIQESQRVRSLLDRYIFC